MNIYFNGYWKNQSSEQTKLHQIKADTTDHQEAIMLTQSLAEEERVNLKSPILSVINCNKGIETQNEAA